MTCILVLVLMSGWGPDYLLSRSTVGTEGAFIYSNIRRIGVDSSGVVHTIWPERDGFGLVYRCHDGLGWGRETSLVFSSYVKEASVVCDKDCRVHLVWHDTRPINGITTARIAYKRYSGGRWQPDTILGAYPAGTGIPKHPVIATDTFGRLHLVWEFTPVGQRFLNYKRWTGTSWDTSITICPFTGFDGPSIATDRGGDVHLVWSAFAGGNLEIIYKRSRNSVWEPETVLTRARDDSRRANLAVDSRGRVHVVWVDQRNGNTDIFYKRFNGTNWEPDTCLVWGAYPKDMPGLCVDGDDRVHVVWPDWRNAGGTEVYYKVFDGVRWGQDYRLTNCWGYSYLPFIVADLQRHLHVTWTDSRDNIGLGMPYYKRGRITAVDEEVYARSTPRMTVVPNPFRDQAAIRLHACASSAVIVRVYDRTGRLVQSLAAGPGAASITWRGSGLPAGLYFVECLDGRRSTVLKVVKI